MCLENLFKKPKQDIIPAAAPAPNSEARVKAQVKETVSTDADDDQSGKVSLGTPSRKRKGVPGLSI